LNSRIPLVRTSSKSAARRRPRRGAARNRGPGGAPGVGDRRAGRRGPRGERRGVARPPAGRRRRAGVRRAGPSGTRPGAARAPPPTAGRPAHGPGPRRVRRGRAGARRAPRGRPRRPPQLGRSTGRARLASRVAAAAGPPGARAPAGGRPPPATGAPAAPGPGNPPGPAAPPPRPPRRGGGGGAGGERGAGREGAARGGAGEGPRGGGPGRGGGGGASSSRGARPAPLRAPARPTQPLEPILIPKLRIRLADFPYLHCSNMPEAVHLGDLLRIWVRPGARFTPSPPDFQGPARAHRTPPEPRRFPRHGPLSRGVGRILRIVMTHKILGHSYNRSHEKIHFRINKSLVFQQFT
uniref:Uncharacterized protein n=1 Tax=Bos mutus grunniens TaxID=30521 RepID=A0A8B9XSU9_BOSMU